MKPIQNELINAANALLKSGIYDKESVSLDISHSKYGTMLSMYDTIWGIREMDSIHFTKNTWIVETTCHGDILADRERFLKIAKVLKTIVDTRVIKGE